MTRPEQPVEYGVQPAAATRPVFRREYRDALGRSMSGYAIVRGADDNSVRVPVLDGVLEVDLQPGLYRIIATVAPTGGQAQTIAGTAEIGRYW